MLEVPSQSVGLFARSLGVFGYSRRAMELVWTTSRRLTVALALLTLVAGILPAAIAYIGQLIVDGVVEASRATDPDTRRVFLADGNALVLSRTPGECVVAITRRQDFCGPFQAAPPNTVRPPIFMFVHDSCGDTTNHYLISPKDSRPSSWMCRSTIDCKSSSGLK